MTSNLFKPKQVPPSPPRFQYSVACTKCGSHYHANGACTTGVIHNDLVRKRIAKLQSEGSEE